MKRLFPAVLALALLLVACQSQVSVPVTIVDSNQIVPLTTGERVPSALLAEAGIELGTADRVLYLGTDVSPDEPLPAANAYTLTVRRAVTLTLVTPTGSQSLQTAAATVGEALAEAGISLYAADRLDPPAGTPVSDGMTITYQPAQELVIATGGSEVRIRSAAATVGEALAGAGFPLVGLDYAVPSASAPPPADGRIRVVRVVESVALTQTSLPYTTRTEMTVDLELDQQEIIQAGEPGLAVSRARIRLEDGVETGRASEPEAIVRPAKDQVTGYGTRIEIRTTTVDGTTIEYWRTLQVYVTSYAPCGGYTVYPCYYYTSSRKPVQIGVVGVVRSWYYLMQGWPIYVPGYGRATIEDVGAGAPAGNHYWVDVGYTDDNYVPWSGWYTIYFLYPVPADIPYVLP